MKKPTVNENKTSNISILLISILSLLLGCILIVADNEFLNTINYALVSLFAIVGVIQIINFLIKKDYQTNNYTNIIFGSIFIWLALFLYVYYSTLVIFLPIMISLYAFILGTITLIHFFTKKDLNKVIQIMIIIVSYIIGIVLLLQPGYSVSLYQKIIGIYLIIASFPELLMYKAQRKNINQSN